MDPSRSEGVASRLPREESLSLYKNEWYDSNTDSTNSTSYNEEVVEKSVKLEEETSKGRMLPAHLTSIKKARVEGGYSGGSWEEGENGKEEDENGKEEDENGKEEDESDKGENESDDGDESDDEGASDDKDESDEEEDGSNKEEDKSGEEEVLSEDFTSSETAADTREHDTQQFVKKRDEERVTEAEAGHTEGLYRLRSQFYGAEAQASIAQSDSTSPYNSEENTRLSVLPIKPDTRFMYVWNMFDKEKTGELKANIFMQFLEKYEEFCWDSNEPLFSREELQAGKMHSSDLGYGKLEMSMSEVKGIVKVFAAEARFQGVMKSFDNENIGAIRVKDLPKFLIALQDIMKADIFPKEQQKEIEQYSKHPALQESYISAMEVKDLFAVLGQPVMDQLAKSITFDDQIYDEKAVAEEQEAGEPKTVERREPRGRPVTPVLKDARERPLAPARVEKLYREMQATLSPSGLHRPRVYRPHTPSPKRHGRRVKIDSPDYFLNSPPLAHSTPVKGAHGLLWSPSGRSIQGNTHGSTLFSPLGAIRESPEWALTNTAGQFVLVDQDGNYTLTHEDISDLIEERNQLSRKVLEHREEIEQQVASTLDISLSYFEEERAQKSELSAEEKNNLQQQISQANDKVQRLEKKLERTEWELDKVNDYAKEMKIAFDDSQKGRKYMQESNLKLRAESRNVIEKFTKLTANQVKLEDKLKRMEYDERIKDRNFWLAKQDIQMLEEELTKAQEFEATMNEQAREIEDLKAKNDQLNVEQSLLNTTYFGSGRSQKEREKIESAIKMFEEIKDGRLKVIPGDQDVLVGEELKALLDETAVKLVEKEEELKAQKESTKQEIVKLEKELGEQEGQKKKIVKLEKELGKQEGQKERQGLKKGHGTKTQEMAAPQSELAATEDELKKVKSERDGMLIMLTEIIDSRTAELEKLKEEWTQEKVGIVKELEDAKSNITELTKLGSMRNEWFEGEIADREQIIEGLDKAVHLSREQVEELSAAAQQLQGFIAKQHSELEEKRKAIEHAEVETKEYKEQTKDLEAKRKENEGEAQHLRESKRTQELIIQSLEKEKDDAWKRVKKLEEIVDVSKDEQSMKLAEQALIITSLERRLSVMVEGWKKGASHILFYEEEKWKNEELERKKERQAKIIEELKEERKEQNERLLGFQEQLGREITRREEAELKKKTAMIKQIEEELKIVKGEMVKYRKRVEGLKGDLDGQNEKAEQEGANVKNEKEKLEKLIATRNERERAAKRVKELEGELKMLRGKRVMENLVLQQVKDKQSTETRESETTKKHSSAVIGQLQVEIAAKVIKPAEGGSKASAEFGELQKQLKSTERSQNEVAQLVLQREREFEAQRADLGKAKEDAKNEVTERKANIEADQEEIEKFISEKQALEDELNEEKAVRWADNVTLQQKVSGLEVKLVDTMTALKKAKTELSIQKGQLVDLKSKHKEERDATQEAIVELEKQSAQETAEAVKLQEQYTVHNGAINAIVSLKEKEKMVQIEQKEDLATIAKLRRKHLAARIELEGAQKRAMWLGMEVEELRNKMAVEGVDGERFRLGLEERLEGAKVELEEAREKADKLQENLQVESEERKQEGKQAKKERKELEKEMRSVLEEGNKKVKGSESELNTLKQDEAKSKADLEENVAALKEARKKVTNLEEGLAAKRSELEEVKSTGRKLQENIQSKLTTKRGEGSAVTEKVKTPEITLTEERAKFEEQKGELQKDKVALVEEFGVTQGELEGKLKEAKSELQKREEEMKLGKEKARGEKESEELQAFITQLSKELTTAKTLVQERTEKVEELETSVAGLSEEVSLTQQKLAEATTAVEDGEKEIRESKSKVVELEGELLAAKHGVLEGEVEGKSTLQKRIKVVKELKAALEATRDELRGREENVTNLQLALDNGKSKNEQERKELEEKLRSEKEEVEKLRFRVWPLENDITVEAGAASNQDVVVNELEEKIYSTRVELMNSEGKIAELTTELTTVQKMVEGIKEKIWQLEEELKGEKEAQESMREKLEGKIRAARVVGEKAKEKVEKLEAELSTREQVAGITKNDLDGKLDAARTANEKAIQEVKKLEGELGAQKQAANATKKAAQDVKQLQTTFNEERAKVEEGKSKLAKLNKLVATELTKFTNDLLRATTERKKTKMKYDSMIKALEEKLSTANTDVAQAWEKVEQLTKELGAEEDEIEEKERKGLDLLGVIEALKGQIEKLDVLQKDEVEKLQEKVRQLKELVKVEKEKVLGTKKKVKDLQDIGKDQEAKIKELEESKEKERKERSAIWGKDLEELKKKIADKTKEAEEKVKALDEEIRKEREKGVKADEQVKELEDTKAALEKLNKELTAKLEMEKDNTGRVQEMLEEIEKKHADALKELVEEAQKRKNALAACNVLQKDLEKRELMHKGVEELLETIRKKFREEEEKVREAEERITELEDEIEESQQGLLKQLDGEKAKVEKAAKEKEIVALIGQVTDMNQRITELKANAKQLQSIIVKQHMEIIGHLNTSTQLRGTVTQLRSTIIELQATIAQQEQTLSLEPRRKLDLKGVQREAIVRALRDLTPEELERLDPKLWPATPYENVTVTQFMFWPILELIRFTIWNVPCLLRWWEKKAKEAGMEDWEIYEPEWVAGQPVVQQRGMWIRGGATPSLPGTPTEEMVSDDRDGNSTGFEASNLHSPPGSPRPILQLRGGSGSSPRSRPVITQHQYLRSRSTQAELDESSTQRQWSRPTETERQSGEMSQRPSTRNIGSRLSVDLNKYFTLTETPKPRRVLIYRFINPHKKCSSPHAWLRALLWVLMFLLLLGSLFQQWAIVAHTEEIKQQWAKPNMVVVRDWLADRRPRAAGWCEDDVCYCEEWWWVRIVREWLLEWLGLDKKFY